MKKLIGTLFIVIGLLILFYRKTGSGCWGNPVDYSLENIGITLILLFVGILLVRSKNKKT